MRYQRKSSSCGIGFQPCLHIELSLTVLVIIADNFTLNGNRLIFEIDRIPSQTEYLAATQTIIGGNVYHQFKPVTLEYLKQRIQLVLIIKGGFILICSRHNKFIHRVKLKILHFHRIGKSRMDSKIILLHGTALAALIELVIKELLNVIMSQLTEGDTRIVNIEILHESPVSTLICLIGSSCKVRTHCRQPLIHKFTHCHL